MTFPDGRVKDGYFENNVFKGNNTEISDNSLNMTSDMRQERSKRDVRVKTRGKSNSINRQLNENNQYSVQVHEEFSSSQRGGGSERPQHLSPVMTNKSLIMQKSPANM